MVDTNKTELVAILDRSGSMIAMMSDVIGGFNSFVEEQKKVPGEAQLTLVLFDDMYEIVHDGLDIQKVPTLTSEICKARGSTALLDAVGKTINVVGDRLAKTPENQRPGKVIFMIFTDGEENDSKEFRDLAVVRAMIDEQKTKYSWEFIFAGADLSQAKYAQQALNLNAVRTSADAMTNGANFATYSRQLARGVARYRTSARATDLDNIGSGMSEDDDQ